MSRAPGPSLCLPVVIQSGPFTPGPATISAQLAPRLQLLPGFLTVIVGANWDSRFQLATSMPSRTPTSARISNLPLQEFPMQARHFPCSVSLRSAWLPCGANCAAKVSSGGLPSVEEEPFVRGARADAHYARVLFLSIAFRRPDARLQSRSFARGNQSLRRSRKLQSVLIIL